MAHIQRRSSYLIALMVAVIAGPGWAHQEPGARAIYLLCSKPVPTDGAQKPGPERSFKVEINFDEQKLFLRPDHETAKGFELNVITREHYGMEDLNDSVFDAQPDLSFLVNRFNLRYEKISRVGRGKNVTTFTDWGVCDIEQRKQKI